MGGATVTTRDVETAYPYPDTPQVNGEPISNAIAASIGNEVLWLERRYDAGGLEYPDLIVIWVGTNAPISTMPTNFDEVMNTDWEVLDSDTTAGFQMRKTFYGGMRWWLERLYRKFPYSTVLVITPVQANDNGYRTFEKLNNTADAMEKMCKRYGVPCCRATNEIGVFDFGNPTDVSGNMWANDGVHPNASGKKLWLNYLVTQINAKYYPKR